MEVYCPRVKIQRSTRRGLVWFTEALFPNYLFARFEREHWQAMGASSPGVSGIVHSATTCPTIPEQALADLRAAMEHTEIMTVPYTIAEGDGRRDRRRPVPRTDRRGEGAAPGARAGEGVARSFRRSD
ncbi:MAG: transcription termination/antitermination NusG family protein [Chthoniobacter sp.]